MAAVKAFGDKSGGVVAIDPRNGEILAMVSRPSFNPTDFSRGIDPTLWRKLLADENRPLRDKTVQDHYSPGSTFKVVTAIAGLEEGVIDANTQINCNGAIQVGNRSYHCHKRGGHGSVDIVKAIASSCDVFFYRVAQKLNSVDQIASWAKHLGLGSRTGIPLNREAPGIIPTEAWKQATFNQPWTAGESLSVAIGQSFVTVTVLQLANAYAALVNGGVLYRPHFLKSVETYDGQLMSEFPEVVMGQSHVKASTLELLKQGLWGVVNSTAGTATAQHMPGMEFAGKTGTIQVVSQKADKIYSRCENLPYRQRHHGMFVGYAPVHNPSIVVAVVGEHVCHGGSGVGPVAKEIFKTYLQKYFPEDYNDAAVAERVKKYQLRSVKPLQFASRAIKSLTPDWPAVATPRETKKAPAADADE
jgi:penicillin-binding protein 2